VFDNFAPTLTGYGHVLGLTRRGFGASIAPESGYSVSRFAKDLLEALNALDLKNAVLIGHSFGGEEMTRSAGVQPNRIAGLVYLDAAIDESEVRKMGANQLDGMRRAMQMKENAWQELLSSMTPPDYHNIQVPAIAFSPFPRLRQILSKGVLRL
jgi:pimeloyl-ACP methyl ester carboxylesterase